MRIEGQGALVLPRMSVVHRQISLGGSQAHSGGFMLFHPELKIVKAQLWFGFQMDSKAFLD